MKLTDIGELTLLKEIRTQFNCRAKDIIAGIGDDAAVVVPPRQSLLLTTDMMAEGIHFNLGFVTPYQVAFKLVSSNVSDIYAMGGTPRFILLNMAMGKDTDEEFLTSFFRGLKKAMALYRIKLIGGDLSSSMSGLVLSATLTGHAGKAVMRSGARPGDRIYVTGSLGDSACGLELLKRINRPVYLEDEDKTNKPLKWRVMKPLIERHLLPVARAPKKIRGLATAMMDISDGLFIDLLRICDESRVGARVYLNRIPLSPGMKKASASLGIDPYRLAASGGEDYELLFTAPEDRKVAAVCIGEITEAKRVVVDAGKNERPLLPEGYQHWH